MNKKGDSGLELILFLLIEVVLVGVVALGLFSFISAMKDNTLLEKNFLSKDLSLVTDIILAAPGYLYFNYTIDGFNLSRYNVDFANNKISVYENDYRNPLKIFYSYPSDQHYPEVTRSIEGKNNIEFEKTKTNLNIGNVNGYVDTLICGKARLTKRVAFENDKTIQDVVDRIKIQMSGVDVFEGPAVYSSKSDLAKRYRTYDDVVLFSLKETSSPFVKAFVTEKTSSETVDLACQILQQFQNPQHGFDGVALVKLNSLFIDETSTNTMLQFNDAIVFEYSKTNENFVKVFAYAVSKLK